MLRDNTMASVHGQHVRRT